MSDDATTVSLLRDAFVQGLDLPPETVVQALSFGQHPRWDSLGHLTLVLEIEKRFSVTLDGDEVMRLDSFAAALEILAAREALPRGSRTTGAGESSKGPA
jgi:acyl carrier protein